MFPLLNLFQLAKVLDFVNLNDHELWQSFRIFKAESKPSL